MFCDVLINPLVSTWKAAIGWETWLRASCSTALLQSVKFTPSPTTSTLFPFLSYLLDHLGRQPLYWPSLHSLQSASKAPSQGRTSGIYLRRCLLHTFPVSCNWFICTCSQWLEYDEMIFYLADGFCLPDTREKNKASKGSISFPITDWFLKEILGLREETFSVADNRQRAGMPRRQLR